MKQCQRTEPCGFNSLPKACVDTDLSKFDQTLTSQYRVNICGPSGALHYGFLCMVSANDSLSLSLHWERNARIDLQLINKHDECVLGIWRLGQTGENIDYHNVLKLSPSPVSTRIEGKTLLRTLYLTADCVKAA